MKATNLLGGPWCVEYQGVLQGTIHREHSTEERARQWAAQCGKAREAKISAWYNVGSEASASSPIASTALFYAIYGGLIMSCWYSKFGPLSWYKREWIRFCVTFGDKVIVDATIRRWRAISVSVGGKVIRRSMYGQPSCIDGSWSFYWPKPLG